MFHNVSTCVLPLKNVYHVGNRLNYYVYIYVCMLCVENKKNEKIHQKVVYLSKNTIKW